MRAVYHGPLIVLTMAISLFPATVLATGSGEGAATEPTVNFETEVLPFLERSCFECHSTQQVYSNLRLDSAERILRGGDLGEVVVPGKPEDSPLYVRVTLPAEDLDVMPVEGDRLSEEEAELLRQWIAEGASFGDWTGR